METGTVVIGEKSWDVQIASEAAELTTGLGGLTYLAPSTGMLFNMGYDQVIQVTTVPMLFNLDIAFIKVVGETWVVSEVVLNAPPGELITSSEECRLFFEVNAGELGAVSAGDEVAIGVLSSTTSSATSGFDISTIMPIMMMVMMMGMIMPMMKSKPARKRPKYFTDTNWSTKRCRYMTQNVLDEAFLQAIKRCRSS